MRNFSIFFILFLNLLLISCGSKEINFIKEKPFSEVIEKAKSENIPLFIEVFASDCHICLALEPHLKDPEVAEIYNSNFINYKLDINDPVKYDLLKNFKINFTGTPTLIIVDPSNMELLGGSVVNETENGKKALIETANFYLKYGKLANLKPDLSKFSREEALNLAELARLGFKDSLAAKAFAKFAKGLTKEQMLSEEYLDIMGRVMISVDNDYFTYFIQHYDEFLNKYGPMRVAPVAENILGQALNSKYAETYSREQLDQIKLGLEKIGVKKEDILRRMWMAETTYLFKNNQDKAALNLLNQTIQLMDTKPDKRVYAYLCDYVKNRSKNPETLKYINQTWCK